MATIQILLLNHDNKKQQTFEEARKSIELKEKLKNIVKQARTDEIIGKEYTEKQFEPVTQTLDLVEKAVKQTDEDLSTKLELIPFKTVEQKQLTFAAEEEKEIRRIVDKGLGVTSKGMGDLAAKYLPFPDKNIWYMER